MNKIKKEEFINIGLCANTISITCLYEVKNINIINSFP